MINDNLINIRLQNSWSYIAVDEKDNIIDFNEKSINYFPNIERGSPIDKILPWFKLEWLYDDIRKRIVKTSLEDNILLQFVEKEANHKKMILNDIFEFKDLMHIWCEVGSSLIRLQPFIDGYDDPVLITSGKGVIRACNNSFIEVSGLKDINIINESIYDLEKKGLIPYCSAMEVIKTGKSCDSIVKFPNGNEVIMSAKPVFDKEGILVRVTCNIRNISKLNKLYEDLTSDVVEKREDSESKSRLKEAIEKLNLGAYRSQKMKEVYETIESVSDYDLPLLITGESGTGKTALAKCIFMSKPNQRGSFVHVNCSAIPEALMESDLFGHEKGSFTGADRPKKGLFEVANDGIILLDEIGDMSVHLQSKLLNVLQEQKFYRVGGTRPMKTNAQVIAASNQDLKKLISLGRFREDLYFRLNVIPINIPALRDRREDIHPLIEQTLKEINLEYNTNKIIDKQAIDRLVEYDWPGNIRELINVIKRFTILSKQDLIGIDDLPKEILESTSNKDQYKDKEKSIDNLWFPGNSLKDMVNEFENRVIDEAIKEYGTIKEAALNLKVHESTITRKRRKDRKN